MAAACPAFSNGPVLASEFSRSRARRGCGRHQRARHRFRRPGAGAAVDHAGVGPGPHGAAAVRAAGVRRRDARTAGPSCPAASAGSPPTSTPARSRWATARAPPTSGWSPTRRFDAHAAAGRRGADQAHRRRAAEPGRRQSVLARPLSRARRGDVAAGAHARHPAARSRQGRIQPPSMPPSASSACSSPGARSRRCRARSPPGSRPKRCSRKSASARASRWSDPPSAPRPRCASGCRPMPGRSSPR